MNRFESLPKTSGVYTFSDGKDLIYIGKAINIQSRVKNHFQQPSYRDKLFIDKVKKISFIKTDSEIEALILEANLIKKNQPKYNVVWRDDKNYFYVAVAKNPSTSSGQVPYVFITHQPKMDRNPTSIQFIGPFVEGTALKKTLRFLRKVFPYYTVPRHPKLKCAYCHLDLCPGPDPDLQEYKKNLKKLILILQGKRKTALSSLKKEMAIASKNQNYEKAGKIRDQISALQKIMSHSHVIENSKFEIRNSKLTGRVECYDVSNIQGKYATGSMVVFTDGMPDKSQYKKFKIKTKDTPDDIAMLKEVLQRRFSHAEWPYPDAILIDGGKAQLNAAIEIKKRLYTLNSRSYVQGIRVMSIAKGRQELYIEGQKNPTPLKNLPQEIYNLIKRLDDEAHRFAISYHKKLRRKHLLL